MRPSFADVIKE